MMRGEDRGWIVHSGFHVDYARHMAAEHDWEVDDVLYFFSKPWKWGSEVEVWAHYGDDKCVTCRKEGGGNE